MLNTLIMGDCLVEMQKIPDKSIDMILCDLPYGTTACKWDTIIPFEPLWEQYKRIIKDNGAIVLFGSEPFSSHLRMSNLKMYKYDWIWEKTIASNFALCNKQPLNKKENICIFYDKQPVYNPQKTKGKPYTDIRKKKERSVAVWGGKTCNKKDIINTGDRFPYNIIKFANPNNKRLHPTQKPVALFEYLIKTYTNEGDIVLDNCAGSGTTGVACKNTNRNYILIEKDEGYCNIIHKRLAPSQ